MGPDFMREIDRWNVPTPPEPPFVYDDEAWVFPVARRLPLSFDGRASGSQQQVRLAVGIDVSSWVSGSMLFVLHTRNAWLTGGGAGTTAQVRFHAICTSLDPDDPSVVFEEIGRVVAGSPVIVAATTAPLCALDTFDVPFGPQLSVVALFSQGAAAAAAAQTLAVSIYLSGRRK